MIDSLKRNFPSIVAGVIVLVIISVILSKTIKGDEDTGDKDPSSVQNISFNIIIDNSASLAGYFNGSTEFKDNTSKLLSFLDKLDNASVEANNYKSTSIYYAAGSSFEKEQLNSSSFVDKMRKGIAAGGESIIDST
jgi:hypothetical protein